MSLLDDLRSAGLDVCFTPDGRVQLSGPADVRDRLRNALRERRHELVTDLRYERDPCCAIGPRRCDHVWCGECDAWANDTGHGPSCHPRHNPGNCIWGSGCWLPGHRAASRDGAT